MSGASCGPSKLLSMLVAGVLVAASCGSSDPQDEPAAAPTPTIEAPEAEVAAPTTPPPAPSTTPAPAPTAPPPGSIDQILSELPPGITCAVTGPLSEGDVIACSHADGRGVLLSIVDGAGTWVGAAAQQFPTSPPGLDAFHADLGSGHNCTDLLTDDLLLAADDRSRYIVALAYFYVDGSTQLMDIDENAIPCETLFPAELVAEIFGGGWFEVDYPTPPVPVIPTADQLASELTSSVSWDGRGWVCEAVTPAPLGAGSVLTCRPSPQPADGQSPLVTMLMLDANTWVAAEAGGVFPLLDPVMYEPFYGARPAGSSCSDLLAEGTSFAFAAETRTPVQVYFAVVLHFLLDGRPTPLMDIDSNGVPCETLFDADIVAQVWAGGYLSGNGMIS